LCRRGSGSPVGPRGRPLVPLANSAGGRGSPTRGPSAGGGRTTAPEHRKQGFRAAAQDLLLEYLLDHTTAHRIEARTNDANTGEQKALERLGFRQEGLMRGRSFLQGKYVGVLVYGLLREDRRPQT